MPHMTGRRVRSALVVMVAAGPLTGIVATVNARPAGAAVTQYADPSIADPTSITPGPDGALWFTNNANDSIGRVTTSGVVTNFTDPSVSSPTAIAAGPDGALWFTNNANSSIGRITTAGVITQFTDPTIVKPIDITAGPGGALWFTNNASSSIGRITTAGVVSNFANPTISNPTSIAVGPDGALWFTNYSSNSIGRITTSGVVSNYADPSGGPSNVTAGPDGALWFTNHGNHSIGRISTGGIVTHFSAPGVDSPYSITTGPDGAMWFTNNGQHSIGRISTSGIVSLYTNTEISNPLGIAAGPDGALWFDNVGSNSIGRITVDTLPASLPDEPTNASASTIGPDGVSVGFTPGFNGGAPITAYTASCISLDGQPTGTVSATGSPILVTGLASKHPYQCVVTATNLVGTSRPSAPSGVVWPGTTGSTCGIPSAPSTVSTAPGNASAVVSWAPAASGCVAGYVVTPFVGSVPQMATLIPGQGTTTVISHLVNGSSYQFTVTAENGSVEGQPSRLSGPVTVGTPSAPTALQVAKVGAGAIHVAFKVPHNNGAAIVRYTASCASSNGGATRAKAGIVGPLTVSALTTGRTYTCTVTAANSRGTGAVSARSAAVKA